MILRTWKLSSTKLLADEGYIALAVQGIHNYWLPYLPSKLVYPRGMLYSYITSIFTFIFGDNEISLRMVSVIAGTALIILIYLVVKKITKNEIIALLTAGVVALHPLFIEFSRFSRWYMLIATLYVYCFYIFLQYIESKNIYYFVQIAVLTTLLPFIGDHGYLSAPFLVFLVCIYYLPSIKFKILNTENRKNIFFIILMLLLVIASTFSAIYLDKFSYYNGIKKEIIEGRTFLNTPPTKITETYQNIKDYFVNVNGSNIIPSIITVLALLINLISNNKQIKRYALFCWAILITSGIVIDRSLARTYFFINPFLLINTILFFYSIFLLIKDSKYKKVLFCLNLLLILVSISFLSFTEVRGMGKYGKIENPRFLPAPLLDYNPDLVGASNYIKENFKEGDIIISSLKGNLYYYLEHLDFWVKKTGIKETSSPLDYYINKRKNYWDYFDLNKNPLDFSTIKNLSLSDPIYIDSVTNAIVLSHDEDVEKVFNSFGKIWVISSSFDLNPSTVGQSYSRLISQNQKNIVYFGKDGITNVFLFQKE